MQHRIELGPLRKLVLLDDLAREVARQHELHLAGDGLGVERLPLLGAIAVGAQKHVLAAVDQDAGLRLVARRDEIDDRDGRDERQHRRHDDPAALARQRRTERVKVDVAGFDWLLRRSNGRRLCFDPGREFGPLGFGFGLRDGPLDQRPVLAATPER
ncbi:hypothetical protein ACVWW5_004004 [Bradyrhizobium sp. LM3.4]